MSALEMYRRIDRRGWLLIACVGLGNALAVLGGLVGSAVYSLIFLAIVSLVWVVLYQLCRALLADSMELAQESTKEWQEESDFTRRLVENQVETLQALSRYDIQQSGIYIARLRDTLIKRHPMMEELIAEVEQPVNVPGLII